jgi:acyl carrier protein
MSAATTAGAFPTSTHCFRMPRGDSLITVDDVARLVRRELRGKLAADHILDETTALADLGLSSLQISEIVFTLEDEHDVEFDTARAAEVRTLGDVVALANGVNDLPGSAPATDESVSTG